MSADGLMYRLLARGFAGVPERARQREIGYGCGEPLHVWLNVQTSRESDAPGGRGEPGSRTRRDFASDRARTAALRFAAPLASVRGRAFAALLLALSLSSCVLEDVQITNLEDVVVAEVLVQIRDDGIASTRPRVFALLHRTPGADGMARGAPGAKVVIRRAGVPIPLTERERLRDCVVDTPDEYAVSCYRAITSDEARFQPGDSLTLEIELPEGERLFGFTIVPGDFRLVDAPANRICVLPQGRTHEVRWTRSPGAWAYVAETAVQDFRNALSEMGFEVEQDRIHLMGVSVSQSDTTIVFPSEFGLLERFTEDQALLVGLQRGIPAGALAQISVAAAERNYVNWQRGGSYNPSGQVRVPSVRGEGTGFFGASVVRTLTVWAPPRTDRQPSQDVECR